MAVTVTLELLRELAGFRADNGCAISLYLDLDPRASPSAVDVETRVNSLLDDGVRRMERAELTHAQKQGLRAGFERIRTYFDLDFSREGVRGLAIFAGDLDNLWRPLPLPESVGDKVKIAPELYLSPLVPLVGRGQGALVAMVGRERGDLYVLRDGRLAPVADHTEEQPRRHDQGGWSQANFQRHIDHLAHEHLRDVAEEIERRVRGGTDGVVIVGTEEVRAALLDVLSKEAKDEVVGSAQAEAHAGPPELLEVVTPVLEAWREDREATYLERWREEAGKNGRAAAGWAPTLEAVSDARVDLLLYRHDLEREAFRCPECGRLAAQNGSCPLDGTHMEAREDGVNLAVHQALLTGSALWAVVSRHDLDPVEGVGALLRF